LTKSATISEFRPRRFLVARDWGYTQLLFLSRILDPLSCVRVCMCVWQLLRCKCLCGIYCLQKKLTHRSVDHTATHTTGNSTIDTCETRDTQRPCSFCKTCVAMKFVDDDYDTNNVIIVFLRCRTTFRNEDGIAFRPIRFDVAQLYFVQDSIALECRSQVRYIVLHCKR